MKEKIEILKDWIKSGVMSFAYQHRLDDALTLLNQLEIESGKLPKIKIEKCKIDLHDGYNYVAELVGIKGMVVSAETKEKAIEELMKSIKVQLLYELSASAKTEC